MDAEIQSGTVARYCKPSTLENFKPKPACFSLRAHERELSVYLLDYFQEPTEKENVVKVKELMETQGFKFGSTSTFVTLDIAQSKHYIFTQVAQHICYRQTGKPPHYSIFHQNSDDLIIAKLLAKCVNHCYPVKEF